MKLNNGVPQGSILGPLLFTVLIWDLHKTLNHCSHHCYADDTQLYISGKVNEVGVLMQNLNDDLKSVAEYSINNCLKLNSKKSAYIIIGSKINIKKLENFNIPDVNIDNNTITRKAWVKNLGVIFDEHLHFDKHVNHIIAAAFAKLKQAYRFKNFLSRESRIKVVESYVLSQFNYCDSIWLNISNETSQKIQKFQNTCIRFIYDLRKYDHVSPSFKLLKTLNMKNRRTIHALTIVHKINNKRAPEYLCNKIKYVHNVHTHNTRGKDKICTTKSKNNYGQNSFMNSMVNKYNSIVGELNINVKCKDNTFKQKCKDYFLKKQ